MYMAYTTNPHMPKVRMLAVRNYHQDGWNIRKVARHYGVSPSAVCKWIKKDPSNGWRLIETESSRPHSHPHALSQEMVSEIVVERRKHNRCSEVVQKQLKNRGIIVSLSSVKRTLDREGLIKKRSPWKRTHDPTPRPKAAQPGDLVQVDTIHIVPVKQKRFYIYTLLDVYSRWAYAEVSYKANTHCSLRFVKRAITAASFSFRMLQSDHGSEFSTWFSEHIGTQGIAHRHSRVRTPNDNGHVERFNRTLKEEGLLYKTKTPQSYQSAIDAYLPYYNTERLHLGIDLITPCERFQAID